MLTFSLPQTETHICEHKYCYRYFHQAVMERKLKVMLLKQNGFFLFQKMIESVLDIFKTLPTLLTEQAATECDSR